MFNTRATHPKHPHLSVVQIVKERRPKYRRGEARLYRKSRSGQQLLSVFSLGGRPKDRSFARCGKSYLYWYLETGLLDAGVERTLAAKDPLAYGVKASRAVLETITQYVHEQGLSERRVALEEIFAPSTLDL